ncbi:hypothetical protein [Pandoraea sp. NPDC087047]|uniref:hypothetical protein n=1 Tax=Pandoraea sp. NPDC087047 TaxID=3364390 RepID=UPI0037FBB6DA
MPSLFQPVAPSSLFYVPADNSPPPARSEWGQMTVRSFAPSHTSSPEDAESLPSIDTLGAGILENFTAIKREWDAAAQAVAPRAVHDRLSGNYDTIVRLSVAVSTYKASDLLGVDELIRKFETAIEKIGGARDVSLGSCKRVDAQRSITDVDQLSPKAKAAFEALGHLKTALDTMVFTLSAKRSLEDHRQALRHPTGPMTPQALETARAELSDALEVTAELVNKTEPLINHCLTLAQAAIPAEKRRWKTKIAILATFLLITVALGIASALAPPLIPAVAGFALGLKIATTGMGVMTALNGMFNVFGYARNRGWSKLSSEIAAVKNLNDAINHGFEARNSLLHSNETTAIQEQLGQMNRDVAAARRKHLLIDRKLTELSDTTSNNSTDIEDTPL